VRRRTKNSARRRTEKTGGRKQCRNSKINGGVQEREKGIELVLADRKRGGDKEENQKKKKTTSSKPQGTGTKSDGTPSAGKQFKEKKKVRSTLSGEGGEGEMPITECRRCERNKPNILHRGKKGRKGVWGKIAPTEWKLKKRTGNERWGKVHWDTCGRKNKKEKKNRKALPE